jgi:hypothetical protein
VGIDGKPSVSRFNASLDVKPDRRRLTFIFAVGLIQQGGSELSAGCLDVNRVPLVGWRAIEKKVRIGR